MVLTTKHVTRYTLCGAGCVYFLIGLTYANVYVVLEALHPGTFILAIPVSDTQVTAGMLDYFSFETLTTVGFGDIAPTTSEARSIVILESVTGVLYLATLVARMVGALGHTPDK